MHDFPGRARQRVSVCTYGCSADTIEFPPLQGDGAETLKREFLGLQEEGRVRDQKQKPCASRLREDEDRKGSVRKFVSAAEG